jgi:methylmalonyl-CoA mutase, N-terminal domain
VGVNAHEQEGEEGIPTLRIDPALERKQIGRVEAVRAARDSAAVESTLSVLKDAAARDENLMEPLLECARVDCTEGEIVVALQGVFGTYTETPVF